MTKSSLHAARVLLVEDEFLIAMDVEQLCRDHGAKEVRLVADHANLGPELLADGDVDVAILDVKLSGNWTLDFARLLVDREIPFIFATGYSGIDTLFADFPGVPVVGKPYTGIEVVEALANAIAGKSQAIRGSGKEDAGEQV